MGPEEGRKAIAMARALCSNVAGANFTVEHENGDKNGRPVDVHCDCPEGMDFVGEEGKDLRCEAEPAEAPAPPAKAAAFL